ncbi:hypothetical protein CYMTET_42617 [Cymbomonas tetramitiformis]|uniref:Uncharacterized protein n=1 Tax=Cymbomonas tetramitiformis TaxID=36881 RepID=A0AAE0F1C2_9CHLO|nr:hypothetical protein CYMTET_42617 [Cymbomonas tetramitiformis]
MVAMETTLNCACGERVARRSTVRDRAHSQRTSALRAVRVSATRALQRSVKPPRSSQKRIISVCSGSDVRDDKSDVDYSEVAKRRDLVTKHRSNGAFTSFVPASENNKSPFKHILDVLRSLLSLKSLYRTGTVVAMALACLLTAPTAAEAAKSSGRMGGSARSRPSTSSVGTAGGGGGFASRAQQQRQVQAAATAAPAAATSTTVVHHHHSSPGFGGFGGFGFGGFSMGYSPFGFFRPMGYGYGGVAYHNPFLSFLKVFMLMSMCAMILVILKNLIDRSDYDYSESHDRDAPRLAPTNPLWRLLKDGNTKEDSETRKLLKESDLDSSIKLLDAVRDSPTCRTPPVPIPGAPTALDDDTKAAREKYEEAKEIGNYNYSKGRHRKCAKVIRQHQRLGDSYFDDNTELTEMGDGLWSTGSKRGCLPPAVRQKHQAGHSALTYPARVDPRPILAMEQRLVRENKAADWTPTAATRKAQFWESLDPMFYTAVKVKYQWLQDLHAYAGGTPGTAAAVGVPGDEKLDSDDILEKLLARLDNIEAFVKSQPMGGAPAIMPKRNRKGLDGFRVGVGHDPKRWALIGKQSGLCPVARDAPRRATGAIFTRGRDCPLGVKRQPAGSAAAYCHPVEDCTQEVRCTPWSCARCISLPPTMGRQDSRLRWSSMAHRRWWRTRGHATGGVDVSAYGFAVAESDDSEEDGMDVHEELRRCGSKSAKSR